MKKNEIFHQKIKPRQILVNQKNPKKEMKKNNTNLIFSGNDNNNILKSDKSSNLYKYKRMSSELINKTNKINSTTKKSRINQNNNSKHSNFRGNKNHNLFFSSENNNLNENLSTNLSNNKNTKGDGTQLDISKSEIQYPLDYSNIESKDKTDICNNTNSSLENNNKEINLRVSSKYFKKNNKEKLKKYNILSPLNKGDYSFGKKLKQKNKQSEYINKRKNKDGYSPDIIRYNNNIKKMKAYNNNNNYYTKREHTFMNTFNSCSNFYQKDQLYSKRKKDFVFNNTMNQYDFKNNNENMLDISDDNMNEAKNKYYNYNSSRYMNDESDETKFKERKNNNKRNNIQNFILYQNYLIEEFCELIEEYMLLMVKNNFETFINRLKQYSKTKYNNSLLLKRIQSKGFKNKFYQMRDSYYEKSNISYLSSNRYNNTNNNINNNSNYPYLLNDFPKEFVRRKTMDNFNKNNFYPEIDEDKTFHRKSQEKIFFNNFESFGKIDYNDNDDTNREKTHKERRRSNEKYDTNLYIPKKYRNLNNTTANKTEAKKKFLHNHSNTIPYFNNKNNDKSKEIQNNLNKEKELDISNGIEIEPIKSKLERNSNKKTKKNKNHNISCDNKYDSKYYMEKDVLNKIDSNNNDKNLSLTNIGQRKENKVKQIYNKKKIKGSQPKSKIIINKQNQENLKGKIIHRNNNNNNLKKEQIVNVNMNINANKKINNKNKNNNEHYGIMTLSSNLSEGSYDFDIIQNEKNEFNIISPKKKNKDIYPINEINKVNLKEKDINIFENEVGHKKQPENVNHKNKLNKENGNNKINYNSNSKEDVFIDSDMKMNKENFDNEYMAREIIVKDVSTRDRRINVFIKYIEDYSFYLHKTQKKYVLIIFQTDSLYIPSMYPSIKDQRYNIYKSDKFYKNMNDKNHKMNKILSSIIEEEEKSKVAGSLNNSISIISDEDNLKNGNYSYYFLQSIKFIICLLHSIISDKKKTLYFQFFKILKKIKNDSFLKGLIIQKKTQNIDKKREVEKNKEKINTSGDILLYNINDDLDEDINYFKEEKDENKNIKDEIIDINNDTLEDKYSTDKNYCLIIDDNLYNLNNSNTKTNMNLSMDNFYLNKDGKHRYDKNILKAIINNNKINKKIKIDKNDLIEFENPKNGKDEINNNEQDRENREDNKLDYEKNITLTEACNRLSEIIFDFKINLIKYGIRSNK